MIESVIWLKDKIIHSLYYSYRIINSGINDYYNNYYITNITI